MKLKNFQLFLCAILLAFLSNCDLKESDCGGTQHDTQDAYGFFFNKPADIYWGVTGGVRSYTYNYEVGNICTQQNPKVSFVLGLKNSNNGMSNPISVTAGIYTCLAVQAQHVVLTPDANQEMYRSQPAEIGMNQCFSGQTSATIYPYITVSFNTLGSSHADSVYLVENVLVLEEDTDYNIPK